MPVVYCSHFFLSINMLVLLFLVWLFTPRMLLPEEATQSAEHIFGSCLHFSLADTFGLAHCVIDGYGKQLLQLLFFRGFKKRRIDRDIGHFLVGSGRHLYLAPFSFPYNRNLVQSLFYFLRLLACFH